jgi:endoglucanase
MKPKSMAIILFLLIFAVLNLAAQTAYVNYAEALQKSIYYYDASKCNADSGRLEWRGPCHMEDYKIPLTPEKTNMSASFISANKAVLDPDGDGCVDVHGGYHDAGDHVKFGLPQGYAASTLGWGLYKFKQSFVDTGTFDHMIEVLKYFTDYFQRCIFKNSSGNVVAFCFQDGDGSVDHAYWGPPELQVEATYSRPAWFATSEKPGADVCAEASAALTLMSLNYQSIDAAYAATCLTNAKALYAFAAANRGMADSGGYYGSAYDHDELSWAAVWLYKATGTMSYIDDITKTDSTGKYTGYMQRIIASTGNTWQNIWVHCWDVVWGGVFVELNELFPDNADFEYFSRWNIEYWSNGQVKHVDASDTNYMAYTPGGYGMINTWGSCRYNTAAELCALVYAKNHNRTDMATWAKGQMTYIMGQNPMNRSYIVGYGETTGITSASHPHHAASHGSYNNNQDNPPENRHKLWGGLVGGPDGGDKHKDIVSDYVYNEVAIDYNAAIVGALAGFYDFFGRAAGDKPLTNFPPAEAAVQEYYIEAKIEQENNARTQVTMKIHAEPVHPPRMVANISCRYYFNISELFSAGQTISAVTKDCYYDEDAASYKGGATITGPVVVDETAGLYYFEIKWATSKIFGSREFQLAIMAAQASDYATHWDPTNDYSRQGLSSAYSTTSNIPMYADGNLVYGQEYGSGTPAPTAIGTAGPTASGTAVPTPPPGCTYALGDANGSGSIDIVDALIVAQYYVGLAPASFQACAADVNKDGSTDIVDALRIAQCYVGLISCSF